MQTNSSTTKFIIGGGITGLVWKFYHPEFQIISPDLGGLYAKTYMVWLHSTSYTIKLLKDLGWKYPERMQKKSYIGYFHKGWIYDYQTDWMNEKIIKRKMTPWDQEVPSVMEIKTKDLSLSTIESGNWMNTLDVDLEEVIKRLSEKADIENGFVTKITKDTIQTKKNFKDEAYIERPYTELVTTMTGPLFYRAYGSADPGLKSVPITNIVVGKRPKLYDDEYEMVYYDETVPFSRISHLRGKWAFEITGVMPREKFEELYPDLPILDYFVIKDGRIWENDKHLSPQENITFSGRFAQWKYGVVTETVIKQAMDYNLNKNYATQAGIGAEASCI